MNDYFPQDNGIGVRIGNGVKQVLQIEKNKRHGNDTDICIGNREGTEFKISCQESRNAERSCAPRNPY